MREVAGGTDTAQPETRGMSEAVDPKPAYHVWFATKGRRWSLLGEIKDMTKKVLVETATEKGINVIECESMVNHVHMLVAARGTEELSWIMKLLKGRSSYEIFQRLPELKLDTGANSFWQRGFAARLVPQGQIETVRRYIQTQDQRLEKYER